MNHLTIFPFDSDLCTSGEGQDPESLLKVVLDTNGITGTPRESIDHFVVSVSTSLNKYLR